MKTVVVIPSRMASTRFYGKPLAKINGREMILCVCDRVNQTGFELYVATPDKEIFDLVRSEGYNSIMTGKCHSGTDRVAEASKHIKADIFINVQGDEPKVIPEDIIAVAREKTACFNSVIGTMCRLGYNNKSIVKVIENAGDLIYLTRQGTGRFAQCGLYGYNKEELWVFYNQSDDYKQKILDECEDIELMRFVDMGVRVKMLEIQGSIAVDTVEDLKRIMGVQNHGR